MYWNRFIKPLKNKIIEYNNVKNDTINNIENKHWIFNKKETVIIEQLKQTKKCKALIKKKIRDGYIYNCWQIMNEFDPTQIDIYWLLSKDERPRRRIPIEECMTCEYYIFSDDQYVYCLGLV